MSALTIQVVFDCADPARLAEFWGALLGYVTEPPPPGFESWDQFADHIGMPPEQRTRLAAVVDPERSKPRLFFQKVPEPKTAKNRLHLDVDVAPGLARGGDERKAAAWARCRELEARGAQLIHELDEPAGWCLVMTDPEGNEFCLH
ncbi:MAG: VOC family protein [Chloroflexi bacterium]|nr:VOC family protein [Chloroflexota bacterium]